MTKRGRASNQKNRITNVRVVDKDDGKDDILCQRMLQSYKESEGQIRVICSNAIELNPGGVAAGSAVDFSIAAASDDFVSFSQQYTEFRVRAIRFDIFDVQPNSPYVVNYWSTYHQIGGTVPTTAANVVDRPDSRSLVPGTGYTSVAWVAHSIPEMAFQSTASYSSLGGLVYNLTPSATVTGTKYQIYAKYVIDFRGRI